MKKKNDELKEIEPKDMPSFLNEIACKYFKDNQENMLKLALCSMYIHVCNCMEKKNSKYDESEETIIDELMRDPSMMEERW